MAAYLAMSSWTPETLAAELLNLKLVSRTWQAAVLDFTGHITMQLRIQQRYPLDFLSQVLPKLASITLTGIQVGDIKDIRLDPLASLSKLTAVELIANLRGPGHLFIRSSRGGAMETHDMSYQHAQAPIPLPLLSLYLDKDAEHDEELSWLDIFSLLCATELCNAKDTWSLLRQLPHLLV